MIGAGASSARRPAGADCCLRLRGCSRAVDIRQALEVTETSGGWYNAGIVDGKNKIVPSVTFRLRKKAEGDFGGVSLNVVFREPPAAGGTAEEEWDEVFIQNVPFAEGNADRTDDRPPGEGIHGRTSADRASKSWNTASSATCGRASLPRPAASQWVELGDDRRAASADHAIIPSTLTLRARSASVPTPHAERRPRSAARSA